MASKNFIGGLLAGAAIGVAIGMLIVPTSVKKAKKRFGRTSRRFFKNSKVVFSKSVQPAKDAYHESFKDEFKLEA